MEIQTFKPNMHIIKFPLKQNIILNFFLEDLLEKNRISPVDAKVLLYLDNYELDDWESSQRFWMMVTFV